MGLYSSFYNALESIQYGAMYMFAAFLGGVGLDYLFPVYDPKKKLNVVVREVLAQCLFLILLVIFIRTYIKQVPILFPLKGAPRNYIPYKTSEFNGEMMMGFVFLGCQLNLINKIDLISDKLYRLYFKEERTALTAIELDIQKNGTLRDRLKQGVVRH